MANVSRLPDSPLVFDHFFITLLRSGLPAQSSRSQIQHCVSSLLGRSQRVSSECTKCGSRQIGPRQIRPWQIGPWQIGSHTFGGHFLDPGAQFAAPIFSRGPIYRGSICWGPIGHSTKKLGAQFTAKSARGPICLEPRILQCYMWVGWMGWDGMGLGWMRWLS